MKKLLIKIKENKKNTFTKVKKKAYKTKIIYFKLKLTYLLKKITNKDPIILLRFMKQLIILIT